MDDIVQLTVDAGALGQQQISFNLKDLLQAVRVEHLMTKCSKNHSQSEMEDVSLDCPECRGTGYVLTPVGEVFSSLIRRQQIRAAKESLWMSQEEAA